MAESRRYDNLRRIVFLRRALRLRFGRMTTFEELYLVQILIGVVTFAALVWYALETRKIRLDAAKQTDLIRQQVELTNKVFHLEFERHISASEPLFQWSGDWGHGTRANEFEYKFKNTGAAVQELSAESEAGAKLPISPSSVLNSEDQGQVVISPRPTPSRPVRFKIHYTTQRQEKRTKFFIADSIRNPVEILSF
jgi:hypothetical protein